MSDDKNLSQGTPSSVNTPRVVKRRRWLRWLGWSFASFVVLIALLIGGLSWYTTTDDFQRRVGKEVKSVLEDATGGRVDIGHIAFSLWHLAIEVDGLVIHGKEAPTELPYLSAAKIFLRVKINTFLSHTVGKGPQSHVGLSFLRVEQPKFHLIIDKDGNTNQPVPKTPSTSTEPVQDTLLDLQAGQVELADGLAVVNDKAIPFDMAAQNLNAEVHYISKDDRYGATVDLANLRTKMGPQPEVSSKLHLTAQIGRDMMSLDSFDYQTGEKTHLSANAKVTHFAKPEWQVDLGGALELKQLGYLVNLEGFKAGLVNLDVHGRNCVVEPQVAQQNPHFWQRHKKKPLPPDMKMLPPDPDCKAGYLLAGNIKAHGVTYNIPNVRAHDVDLAAQLRVTPTELLFTSITSTLPGGGRIGGDLKIENWLGEVPSDAPNASSTAVAAAQTANTAAKGINAKAPIQSLNMTDVPVNHAHAYLTVTVADISLRTIMEITAPEHYGDLGFDTSITGPVKVEWGGPVKNISDSVQVQADLKLKPTGQRGRGYPSNIPLSGAIIGHYDGATEVVRVQTLNIQTPATTLDASGILGVAAGDPQTNLRVNLAAHDLGEFDQLFKTLGLDANGKKGTAAIPVVLHGALNFNGTARGAIANLDVKGHLDADNLAVKMGSQADVHIDSVVADAEYSPNAGLAVATSTIKRGTAVLNVTGKVFPHRIVSRRGGVTYAWDNHMTVDAGVKLANAQVADLLDMAGQKSAVPVTGTINVDAHVAGQLDNFHGGGNVRVTDGAAYGENFQQVSVDLAMQGQEVDATNLLVQAHGMQVTGSGGYNLQSKHIKADLNGNNITLSKLDTVKAANANVDGVVTLHAQVDGTPTEPNLKAQVKVANITVQGQQIGQLDLNASSAGSLVSYSLNANALGSQLNATGKTSLLGEYQTDAKLTVANVDVANIINAFSPGSIKASSKINGYVTVSGPAKNPMKLAGNAEFTQFSVTLQGIELKTAEPLRLSLRNGVASLDQLHIVGQDTDLQASGTAQVFGDNDPNGGKIDLKSSGSINMGIVHLIDADYVTSGKVSFEVAADGRMKKPGLTGHVKFDNVAAAMAGVPNGLSQMNGTMVFTEGRLDVENLTAVSGGGKITLGGSILYQKGLFADLTAKADTVRIRYGGLSATANADLKLQGGPNALILRGNVLITRFNVGADVDFAAFSGTGGVQLPPDPTAASNKLRLDVHIQSSPQLDFQNSYAKLAGSVDLTVRGTAAVPSVLGRITITDGSATFAGTRYQLDRGVIYFSNPVRIDPTIDLDVSTRVENYDITIGVHGTTSNLQPTYRSSPPLTQQDIFSLLALGRTQEESSLYSQQQTQSGTDPTTNSLLGGALNATVSSRVNKLFGGGSVKIDPAFMGTLGNSAARITVVEPITKQITLTFATNVNQSAQQLIQVQYQVNDNVSIVATRDESGVFSIVYKIRKRYR
ncbi:translocation/assembly module TamB domain-containing protein [Granulicella cerasi]|uniref:Translocation/assembly module TamB domain-containing protein n=1 Tax=Granulicella cerasi TaxID=741063 RepID=A0ABW1ZEI4_9BACT|nr:translocation/assembly module TamB domain-containing protein [Granulicella cerasi]